MGSNGSAGSAQLRYALNDVENMTTFLSDPRCDFKVKSPSWESDIWAVYRQLSEIASLCDSNDTFICHFSGHGRLVRGSLFLLWNNSDTNNLTNTALSVEIIMKALSYCKAQSKLLILDCCHAGAVINMPKNGDEAAIDEIVIKPDNFLVLMAAARSEQAREVEELKGGFLTANICDAIAGKLDEADFDKDGRISIYDLKKWLENRFKQYNETVPRQYHVPLPYLYGQYRGEMFITLPDHNNVQNKWDTLDYWKGAQLECCLTGHSDSVGTIAISPDGKTLASGSFDGTIKVFNLHTKEIKYTLNAHQNDVSYVIFSPEGELITSSYDGTIKIWNLHTKKVKWTLIEENEDLLPIESLCLSPNTQHLFVSSYESHKIHVWDLPARKKLGSLSKHKDGVICLAISPDGRILASGGKDKKIILWEVYPKDQTLEEIYKNYQILPESNNSEQHSDWITSLAISPNNQVLASGSKDGKVYIWNLHNGTLKDILNKHSGAVISLAFSPDGQTIASGSFDNTIKLYNWHTGKIIRTLTESSGYIQSLLFSSNGQMLLSSGKRCSAVLGVSPMSDCIKKGGIINIWMNKSVN
ncbi:MAG: hypothetical protein F6K65_13850 [Moorea sp. SIO3C2]|nr:hypothetical protein [Moorena sp. SIO3C2]